MFGSTFTLELYEVEPYDQVDEETGAVMKLSRKAIPERTRKFTASALSIQGSITLDEWIRERHVTAATLACKKLPEEVRRIAIAAAANEAPNLTWNSAYGAQVLGCLDGMVLFASCILGQNHSNLTQEQLYTYLVCPDNMRALSAAITKAAAAHPIKPSVRKPQAQRAKQQRKAKKSKKR